MIKSLSARLVFAYVLFSILLAGRLQAQNLVVNGDFEISAFPPNSGLKGYFNVHNSVTGFGWTGGVNPHDLTFLIAPGTADNFVWLDVYGPFPKSSAGGTSIAGGNAVMADGDPFYSGPIYQQLHGLTPGRTYEICFDMAAGQQRTYTGGTTELWRVNLEASLGSSPLTAQDSYQYVLPQAGIGQWRTEKMTFVSPTSSPILSFLAVGTPDGMPPICFLDNVCVYQVPEVSSILIVCSGLLVSVAAKRFRTVSRVGR